MKRTLSFFTAIALVTVLQSQIVVNQSDMPSPGDTIRISTAVGLNGQDPALTGAGITWNYANLSPLSQAKDSFISVTATPFIFQLVFNNPTDPNRATLAQLMPVFDLVPGLSLQSVYSFYRSTASLYSFVGYAGEVSGIPIPAKFSSPDVLYVFPMQYGQRDSATSILNLSLPGLGTVYINRYRRNYVDGYGTLTTPFGTSQVLKIRSEVAEYDSVYLDTLGQGIALNRIYTEYKWIGKGFDLPLLQVVQEGPLQTVTYIDSARVINTDVSEWQRNNLDLQIFPNPVDDELNLVFALKGPAAVTIELTDLAGRSIVRRDMGKMQPGEHLLTLREEIQGLSKGSYIIRLQSAGSTGSGLFMKP